MIRIKIRRFKIILSTTAGSYGFECRFESGINIVRGNNSSGKSTLINSLIYSLGMEEIIGGKGNKVLPYALKEYVEDSNGNKVKIVSSYVFIELENHKEEIITFKRSIISDNKDPKLVEIIHGPYLTAEHQNFIVTPTYLHDKGSAQEDGTGFFKVFEDFIGFDLPFVAGRIDDEIKLYIQTIFSSLFIEQKRGWTDYIANTPYYQIRNVKLKIIEFLLDLDVFENEKERNRILSEISKLQKTWSEEKYKIKLISDNNSLIVRGVNDNADAEFDIKLVQINKITEKGELSATSYIGELIEKIDLLNMRASSNKADAPEALINSFKAAQTELERLSFALESNASEIRINKSRLQEYKSINIGVEEDLKKNKIALKLKKLGAESDLKVAKDICPSCHQQLDDSLFLADTLAQPMSIDENIQYLENQKKMIHRYIIGLETLINTLELQSKTIGEQIAEQRAFTLNIKKDLRVFTDFNEADIRLKFQLESKIETLTKGIDTLDDSLSRLTDLSVILKKLKSSLLALPKNTMSQNDTAKTSLFERCFRELANDFGYKSAPIIDIEINKETLFPYLAGIELREVNTDIKSDSSASDFVRLIWAYLISVFKVSNIFNGNHPGLIIFDEPAQHSMAISSVNALLKELSQRKDLQSIVAASFDESDDIFAESTEHVSYNLIKLENKLLQPILH